MRHLLAPSLIGVALIVGAVVFVNTIALPHGATLAIAFTAMALTVIIGVRADQRHRGVATRLRGRRRRPSAL